MKPLKSLLLPFLLLLPLSTSLLAQDDSMVVREQVSGYVYMLSGGGYANISVLAGAGEALMVDSKSPAVADQIRRHVRELTGGGVRYLINGHEHPDHTDGNQGFGADGSIIIAHEDVLSVLSAGQRGGPPAPREALPVVTIPAGGEMTIHFAGETVRLIAAPPAHSPANLLIQYENANVLHMGDLLAPTRYPVIAGGSIDGFIRGSEMALALANEQTKLIPGVGPLCGIQELRDSLDMLRTTRQRVAELKQQGRTLEQVLAAAVTAEFDATYGDPARFIPGVYQTLP